MELNQSVNCIFPIPTTLAIKQQFLTQHRKLTFQKQPFSLSKEVDAHLQIKSLWLKTSELELLSW